MAFIAGAVVLGGVVVIGYDKYSDSYSDYRYSDYRYSDHRQYGDSALRNQISNKENEVHRKESSVDDLRSRMNDNFNSRINELKREKNYSALNSPPNDIVYYVKNEMSRELDNEISHDKQELAAIDKMIARINEIELQAKRE